MAPMYPTVRRLDLDLQPSKSEALTVRACVTAEYQAQFHQVAPVDNAVFGGQLVDPGFITMQINYAILGGNFQSASFKKENQSFAAPGRPMVHASEYLIMHRGVRLGEAVTIRPVKGSNRTSKHRLGSLVSYQFEGRDCDEQLVWQLTREGIAIGEPTGDPESTGGPPKAITQQSRHTDARTDREFVCSKTFSPELVLGYCNDFSGLNPIHHDPEVAAAAGFRQPIWAGAQGIHLCVEHLCKLAGGLPSAVEMSTKLRRVVCWDETVELWYRQAPGQAPGVGSYVVLRVADGYKPAIEFDVLKYSQAMNSRL